jgi:hypothetical protein
MKRRSGDKPNNNYKHSTAKRPGASEQYGRTLRETSERVPDGAKEITLLLVFLRYFCRAMFRHVT